MVIPFKGSSLRICTSEVQALDSVLRSALAADEFRWAGSSTTSIAPLELQGVDVAAAAAAIARPAAVVLAVLAVMAGAAAGSTHRTEGLRQEIWQFGLQLQTAHASAPHWVAVLGGQLVTAAEARSLSPQWLYAGVDAELRCVGAETR